MMAGVWTTTLGTHTLEGGIGVRRRDLDRAVRLDEGRLDERADPHDLHHPPVLVDVVTPLSGPPGKRTENLPAIDAEERIRDTAGVRGREPVNHSPPSYQGQRRGASGPSVCRIQSMCKGQGAVFWWQKAGRPATSRRVQILSVKVEVDAK